MLSRYTIYRRRPKDAGPLPDGVRQDTRFRTRHVLRPTQEMVEAYLADPSEKQFKAFHAAYRKELKQRLAEEPEAFAALAELARKKDVYLGCNCPTQKNPDVRHCHTWMALEFMAQRFPDLDVVFPE